mgnify:CR=1 FL=1
MNLLKQLIIDEKKINNKLYSAGPYWEDKAKRASLEIKRFGLGQFRGSNSNVGGSFADNEVLDARTIYFLGRERFYAFLTNIYPINKIFKLQLRKTKQHFENYLNLKQENYKNSSRVKYLLNKYKLKNTVEFGCINKFSLGDKSYSFHYLNLLSEHDYLADFVNYKNINSVFEIGGGFGVNIHILLQNYPNIKKILYLDIVPNLFIGTEYLKHFYKDAVLDYNSTRNNPKIKFSKNNDLKIICIAPWQIEKVDCSIDYFHNSHSFIEMTENIIRNYVKYIEKFCSNKSQIVLTTYTKNTSAHLDIVKIINNVFKYKINNFNQNLLLSNRKIQFFYSQNQKSRR